MTHEAINDSTGIRKKPFIFLDCLHKRLEMWRKNQSSRKAECMHEGKLTVNELNDNLNQWNKFNVSGIKFDCFVDCYLQKEGLVRIRISIHFHYS